MTAPHSYARNSPGVSKNVTAGSMGGLIKESDKEERNRAPVSDASENGREKQPWTAVDMSGQNLKILSPPLFSAAFTFTTKLYLNNNKLTYIPPLIGRLRSLVSLDLSLNQLTFLPPEIGMLVNLREFLLFDNHLETLPFELGSLYQLDILGIEGNPLKEDLKSLIVEYGTSELIKYLREQAQVPDPPSERDWIVLDDTPVPPEDKLSVLSYNILCDRYATQAQYGYTSASALAWEHRRDVILEELRARDADILCLQEMDNESFDNFFRPSLAHNDYKGYILLDKQLVDFANTAINRPDMKGEHDIFNRVMPRDHIAVVAFLENRMTGVRVIVVNTHIFWDPAYNDVKVVQVAILMERLTKLAEHYAKWPPAQDKDKEIFRFTNGDGEDGSEAEEPIVQKPAPSMEYSSGASIPLLMCGDFNSAPGSGVYDLIAHGSLANSHTDLAKWKYGNFTRDGMTHPFSLKSSYASIGELSFTNYTPGFTGVIDYIWYSTNALQVSGLLGDVDKQYLERVPGFPNYHFPSDHLALLAEFVVKGRKEKKIVEADFGPQRDRRT
ncbi:Glucose-repressible alcohol dehydrogenase transcriptional effector [Coniosporium tulheliwenetii]|uniref:Glucose-repressible alcohol dehydrogenase transcriptional effector n=1 Tax=Coniosporium tulheliwenetii TaxID=3383036 RepID=A0ACC2ZHQ9_9PEZI|nr:Glucose-repressible alcohol dehydrogenase transcriptional effector [Cladosporium sp. JES 115]